MSVVAAQMRHTGNIALVWEVVVFMDWQRVSVGAKADGLLAISCRQGRDDPIFPDAFHDVVAPGSHQVGDVLRRLGLFE